MWNLSRNTMYMMKRNFLRCGMAGWCMEILWTGLHSFRVRDPKLTGHSSLWMFPIYGCAAFLEPLMRRLISTPFWKRGLIYMLCIYLGEYTSGILLRYKNACPWNYEKSPFHIQRVIRLDFAPLWFCAGLFFERLLIHSDF